MKYRIYIPTGSPEHIEAIVEWMPKDCKVEFNNMVYADGHKEGWVILRNGNKFAIDCLED